MSLALGAGKGVHLLLAINIPFRLMARQLQPFREIMKSKLSMMTGAIIEQPVHESRLRKQDPCL